MIFTAYLDESGTHAGASVSALAGFVGHARQWRKFEKRVGRLSARFHVNIFHAIDVRRGDDDFEGWTVDKKIDFYDEFQHIINDTLESGVVAFLEEDDYKYYRNLYWPKKTRPDSKYTLMFRGCLAHIVDVIGHIPDTIEPHLYVVLEDGHKNAQDVVRNYDCVRGRLGNTGRALSGLSFDNKKSCLPLAAADLFAYSAWGNRVGQKPIGVPKKPPKSEASYRGNMFWVGLNRDSLDSLHEQAIDIANGRDSSVPYVLRRQPS
jgi:hypothetical protein